MSSAFDYVINAAALAYMRQLTGQPAFPIFASAKDRFFLKVIDAQLDLARDAGGKVVAVVLHQNGRNMQAPRMTTQR